MELEYSGCGIIIFNANLDTILVESFKGKNNCSFPKGRKDSQEESDLNCALREVKEETGLLPNQLYFLNDSKIFGGEKLGKHEKPHYIGYFLAMFVGNCTFNFTFDKKELKGSPYWANYDTVMSKFYSGDRRTIYENAYNFVKKYLSEQAVVPNNSPISKKPTQTWASIAKKGLTLTSTPTPTPTSELQKSPIKTILFSQSNLTDNQCVQIGKTLSWLLRHGLDERGLTMRSDGYVRLDDVMNQKEFSNLTIDDIKYIVDTNSKKRYELLEENGMMYIKASQGHSKHIGKQIDQTTAFKLITNPEIYSKCIHGTDRKSWKLIKKTGLNRMTRQHIHFALSEPSDSTVISGARSSSTILIYVDMKKAMDDGIIFYLSDNGVILSEGVEGVIDPQYFSKVVDNRTGEILI